LKELSDEKLMEMVKFGKLNFIELLFTRYQKQLYNYFLKCTLNPDESQDLTQNTFIRVMKYRQSYKVKHGFRVWLFQIARNQVKDYFRIARVYNNQFSPLDHLQSTAEEEIDREQLEREEKLHKALARLPPEKRELLVMGKFQGLKYEEIADIRRMSVGAVKVQIHRTIAELRKIYFEELGE